MGTVFWIRRTLLVFALTTSGIALAQWLKGHDWAYSVTEALIWGSVATAVFTVSRIYQSRRGKQCALCRDTPEMQQRNY